MKNQVTYQMNYEFDMESFVRFMMIQSNVNSQTNIILTGGFYG